MKKYLNKQQKMDVIILGVFGDKVREISKTWGERNNLTSKEKKALNTAGTLLVNTFNNIGLRMDDYVTDQILREAVNTQVICVPREQGKIMMEKAKQEKAEEEVVVSIDTLFDLAELALVDCTTNCKKDVKSCTTRHVLMTLDIPMICYEHPICPYMGEVE